MRKKPSTRNYRYHLRNWKEYNSALKARGSLTLWMDESAINNWIKKPRPGEKRRPGAQMTYSDMAIRCLLTLKAVYHLPLRATEGFARSVIALMRLDSSGCCGSPEEAGGETGGRRFGHRVLPVCMPMNLYYSDTPSTQPTPR
jgi:hypothetical protein